MACAMYNTDMKHRRLYEYMDHKKLLAVIFILSVLTITVVAMTVCTAPANLVDKTPEKLANTSTSYIGLTEESALAKAKEANIPCRVVERNGEGLIITMEYAPGRLNLYVKDGKVYKVNVEGQ